VRLQPGRPARAALIDKLPKAALGIAK